MQTGVLPAGVRHDADAPADSMPPAALDERTVATVGLALAGGLLAAAAIAGLSTALGGGGPWASLHLALAGAAGVALATFMPHFAVTLAGTAPAAPRLRLTAIGLQAVGGVLVVAGLTLGPTALAVVGGAAAIGALGLTGWLCLRPLREPLARRHPVVALTYGVALAELVVGIGLAVAFVAGADPVVTAWARLKVSHVWLNLFGAVSLVIASTLVYLYPTVLGARIRFSPSLAVLVAGLVLGPPLTAAGVASATVPVAVAGAMLATAGSAALAAYAVEIVRRRGSFAADLGWRRVAVGHLSMAIAWFALAMGGALAGVVRDGPAPAGWTFGALAIPFVGGWVLQALVGSWSHLLPAVTPGGPERHRRQRQVLAFAGRTRLVAWNAGIGLAWAGIGLDVVPLAVPGAALLSLAVAGSVVLAARALTIRVA